jgi:ADP-heptose:LPS heptosyltransferase
MDSANMHLASLVEVPVVSIWGATHPSLGFYGFRQDINNAIQPQIACRPCSVFGEVPCYRGDCACLHQITGGMIVDKIASLLDARKN